MTLHGVAPRGQVDDSPIDTFIRALSALSAEDWQRRIEAFKTLVNSTPDYSTTYNHEDGSHYSNPHDNANNIMTPCSQPHPTGRSNTAAHQTNNAIIPWYRSSKSVRRLAAPLKTLLLDARSAVVKEATELIGLLMSVKLQCHPSFLTVEEEAEDNEDGDNDTNNDADKEIDDIFNNTNTAATPKQSTKKSPPPPPPFVGRLLFKDLLPSILQLSAQTVKVIRSYGVNMTLQMIPHCRVKSALVILLERMKSDKNRNVREDCGRYLRCVLDTWPVMMDDDDDENKKNKMNSRTEERLSYEAAQQIGMGLGRALTDPAQPVRNETKRGFQVVFQRFRPVWNEVMNSGIIRDVRLRKNLLEAASRSEDNGGLFDDMASLGDLSLNTSTSFTSMRSNTSYRSYASRGMGAGNGGCGGGRAVPSVIGTPKVNRKYGVSSRYSPSASTTTTTSSGTKIRNKESSSTFSTSSYVLSSGHVVSSSSPRRPPTSPRKSPMTPPPKQPFASLMQTPQPNKNDTSPTRNHNNNNHNANAIRQSPKPAKMLRKRLSRRISGIYGLEATTTANAAATTNAPEENKRQLSSIAEKSDDGNNITNGTSPSSAAKDNANNNNSEEITYVALEVISAHLAHLDKIENQVSREKDLLLDLNKQLGISISDSTNSDELAQCLNKLTEEQVCDYFESVHVCVDLQRNASESLLREMERISQGGDVSMSSDVMDTSACSSNNGVMDGLPQSPLPSKSNGLERVQRDLGAQF
mmetsp:Transcript_9448/g.18981  ORF Transcript_9448/g.18981 Transcript_9448/m.18981 type:complete len:751 (-) Transcript_9448:80-2332(-)